MKSNVYVLGIGCEHGVICIRPVLANDEKDAKKEYVDLLLNDLRLKFIKEDFDTNYWTYKNTHTIDFVEL
jgi:hypothetical protein